MGAPAVPTAVKLMAQVRALEHQKGRHNQQSHAGVDLPDLDQLGVAGDFTGGHESFRGSARVGDGANSTGVNIVAIDADGDAYFTITTGTAGEAAQGDGHADDYSILADEQIRKLSSRLPKAIAAAEKGEPFDAKIGGEDNGDVILGADGGKVTVSARSWGWDEQEDEEDLRPPLETREDFEAERDPDDEPYTYEQYLADHAAGVFDYDPPEPTPPSWKTAQLTVDQAQKLLAEVKRLSAARSPEGVLMTAVATAGDLFAAATRALEHTPGGHPHNQQDHAGDGVPDVLTAKLKGAGNIDLVPGERLLRSDRLRGEGGRAWLAVTEKDGKRGLRLGLGNANFGTRHDHGGPWRAGPDRTAEIDAERAELRADIEELEDELEAAEADPETDPRSLEERRAQLEDLYGAESGVGELPGGSTAMLDEGGARQLREALAKALDDGKKVQTDLDEPYQELDRLTNERDRLKLRARGRKFTDEEDAEWDRLTAEISRAQAELDPTSGPERPESGYWTFAEGSIPGQWADVHYDIYLDDPSVGVEVKLGAVPHGSDMDFDDMRGAEMTASFDAAEADELVKLLAKMEKPNRSPEGVTRVHNGTRSLEAMLSSPAVQLMMLARTLEARDIISRRGRQIVVERGRGGRFARMGGPGDALAGAAQKAVAAAKPRQEIRQAYRDASGGSKGFVRLDEVRARLGHIPQDEVDRELKQMAREKLVHLAPNDYQFNLTPEQRAGSVEFGGRANHLIMVEDDGGTGDKAVAPAKPRRSAVAKAMASGDTNALDGFGREALRREAKARGIDVPRGAHEDVIKDMLWDNERDESAATFDTPAAPEPESQSVFGQIAASHKAMLAADRERALARKAGTAKAPKAGKPDMGSVLSTLRQKKAAPVSGDREVVDDLLGPLSHKELDEIAREFGADSYVRGTREQKRRQLREHIVGARLDHDAIMRTDLGSPLGPRGEQLPPPRPDSPQWMWDAYNAQQAKLSPAKPSPRDDYAASMAAIAGGENIWEKIRKADAEAGPHVVPPSRPVAAKIPRPKRGAKPKPPTDEERQANANAISGGLDIWAKLRQSHDEDDQSRDQGPAIQARRDADAAAAAVPRRRAKADVPAGDTLAARKVMGTQMSLPMQQALVKVEDSGGLEMRRAEFIHDHKLSEREFDQLVDNGFIEEDEMAGLGFIGITPRGEQAIKALRQAGAEAPKVLPSDRQLAGRDYGEIVGQLTALNLSDADALRFAEQLRVPGRGNAKSANAAIRLIASHYGVNAPSATARLDREGKAVQLATRLRSNTGQGKAAIRDAIQSERLGVADLRALADALNVSVGGRRSRADIIEEIAHRLDMELSRGAVR